MRLAIDFGRFGWIVFGGLMALLAISSAVYLFQDYQAHRRDAERRLATMADPVAEYVQQVMTIIDLTLHSVDTDRSTSEIVISLSPGQLHEPLKAAQAMSPVLQGLGVVGSDGKVIASAGSPNPAPTDLSDRDYFLQHRDDPRTGLLVGRPVMARPQNVMAIPVSRRTLKPDGSFGGVIAARLDPRSFNPFFASVGADVVTVVKRDGTLIARFPETDLTTAPPLAPTHPIVARSQSEPRGFYVNRSPIDGVERIIAFRAIGETGLVVATSYEASSITRAWLARSYPFFALVLGGLAFLGIVGVLVQRQARFAASLVAATAAAQAAAEHAAEVKGTFLANMSHEIRTPLGGILGYADLLLKSDQGGQQRDWTVKLRSAGEQLVAVINDILDYSKLEAGDFAIDPKPVSLASLIDEVRSMMAPQADARGLDLRSSIEPGLPRWIRIDPVRLKQILINLVSNAIKFTDKGVVAIAVGARREAGREPALGIDVLDTGIGIPDDKVASVFERFTQAEGGIAKGRGGTGLGLSISRRLAELMGGSLTLDSKVGTGTNVHLTLPLDAAPEPAVRPTDMPAAARTGRILLVDDLPMNLEIAGAMLRAQGHEVTTAIRGMEAVDVALAGAFDAILLDVQLPDIDGYEVAREIRKLEPDGRRTPILALTANALPEHIAQALASGMDGHIAKPIEERTLIAQLARVLSPPSPSEPKALIDEFAASTLRRLLGPGRLADMKTTFWKNWDGFARGLDAASIDRQRLRADTHDMVSHAGNVGYLRLAEACSDLSDLARSDPDAELGPMIATMTAIAEQTRREDPEVAPSDRRPA